MDDHHHVRLRPNPVDPERLLECVSDPLNELEQEPREPGNVLEELLIVQLQHGRRLEGNHRYGNRIRLRRGNCTELRSSNEITSRDLVSVQVVKGVLEPALNDQVE